MVICKPYEHISLQFFIISLKNLGKLDAIIKKKKIFISPKGHFLLYICSSWNFLNSAFIFYLPPNWNNLWFFLAHLNQIFFSHMTYKWICIHHNQRSVHKAKIKNMWVYSFLLWKIRGFFLFCSNVVPWVLTGLPAI